LVVRELIVSVDDKTCRHSWSARGEDTHPPQPRCRYSQKATTSLESFGSLISCRMKLRTQSAK
jgi:hypothetical protein